MRNSSKVEFYRINFDDRQQMRDYMLYYRRCSREFRKEFDVAARAIIGLSLLGWSRRKMIARSKPKLTEYQISAVSKSLPCMTKLRRIIRQLSANSKTDAMVYIYKSLDINGENLKIGGTD